MIIYFIECDMKVLIHFQSQLYVLSMNDTHIEKNEKSVSLHLPFQRSNKARIFEVK